MEHTSMIKSLKSNIKTQQYDNVEIVIRENVITKFQKTNTFSRSIRMIFNNILFGQDYSDIDYIKIYVYTDHISLDSQIMQSLRDLELRYNDKIILIHNIK